MCTHKLALAHTHAYICKLKIEGIFYAGVLFAFLWFFHIPCTIFVVFCNKSGLIRLFFLWICTRQLWMYLESGCASLSCLKDISMRYAMNIEGTNKNNKKKNGRECCWWKMQQLQPLITLKTNQQQQKTSISALKLICTCTESHKHRKPQFTLHAEIIHFTFRTNERTNVWSVPKDTHTQLNTQTHYTNSFCCCNKRPEFMFSFLHPPHHQLNLLLLQYTCRCYCVRCCCLCCIY